MAKTVHLLLTGVSLSAALGGGCHDAPQVPLVEPAFGGYALVTAAEGFSFYPPLSPPSEPTGAFEGGLTEGLDVTLLRTSGGTEHDVVVGRFDRSTSPALFEAAPFERYVLNLDASALFTERTSAYRFVVAYRGVELGRADMPDQIFSFLDRHPGLTMGLHFRVERRAIDRDLDGILDPDDHCPDLADPANPLPSPEQCDGADNDCNGLTDDGSCAPAGPCHAAGSCTADRECLRAPLADGTACVEEGITQPAECRAGACVPVLGTAPSPGRSCSDILAAGASRGDGLYWIDPSGRQPVQTYCDMTTDGGGWTLVASAWIPSHAMEEPLRELGQFTLSGSFDYDQLRLRCESTATVVNRTRTFSAPQTDLGGAASDAVEYYDPSDNVGRPSNSSAFYFGPTEWHWLGGQDQRFIIRPGEVHCGRNYSQVGGANDNPALGRWGQVWVRTIPVLPPGQEPATSCSDVLARGGSTGDGLYTIDPDGRGGLFFPFSAYCDMTTDGGGWTLVASTWISAYTMPAPFRDLGQLVYGGAFGYDQMRLRCESTGTTVDRTRTFYELQRDLSAANAAATETYGPLDNVGKPSNTAAYYFGPSEWHWFGGENQRFILRPGEVHCGRNYSDVGGAGNNPALGWWGQVWIRTR